MKNLFVLLLIIFWGFGFILFSRKQPVVSQTQNISGFICIDGGRFTIGSPKKEHSQEGFKGNGEKLQSVTIGSYYIAKYVVTQKDYFFVMKNEIVSKENEYLPVDEISWIEALEFCNKLSILHDLEPVYTIFYDKLKYENFVTYDEEIVLWNKKANGYRLPTSAEWECAARAGTKTPYYTGKKISASQANFGGSTSVINLMPVGSFAPNPWNLYDMAGNVYEWCWDWVDENHTVLGKIIRGGASWSSEINLRSAAFKGASPTVKGYGFRLARNAF